LLWVRETWAFTTDYDGQFLLDGVKALYRASDNGSVTPARWRPSIHMPRWASRLMLRITDVRVERLQDITTEDAIKEGIEGDGVMFRDYSSEGTMLFTQSPLSSFCGLWDRINAHRGFGWAKNPWVWALTFALSEGSV
jgi:hypothetical protein